MRDGGGRSTPAEVQETRLRARAVIMRCWAEYLADWRYGTHTINAICQILKEWCDRFDFLSFRLMQVLYGHGCYGWHLHKIARKEPTASCHECGAW